MQEIQKTADCSMADASTKTGSNFDLTGVNLPPKERSYPHEVGQWTTHVYVDGKFSRTELI